MSEWAWTQPGALMAQSLSEILLSYGGGWAILSCSRIFESVSTCGVAQPLAHNFNPSGCNTDMPLVHIFNPKQ